jgi:sugar phosphate permease
LLNPKRPLDSRVTSGIDLNLKTVRKTNSQKNLTLVVLIIGYIGYYLCRNNLSAAYPALSRTFDYSNTELGLIAFYSELVYAGGKFINGPLGDRWGGKNVFILGMMGAILANLAFSFMSSLWVFICVWSVCRYFLSMGWGGIVKIVGETFPANQNGTVMGIVSINFQLGGVASALFTGYLISIGAGWQALFVWPAAILSVIMIFSWLALSNEPLQEPKRKESSYWNLKRTDKPDSVRSLLAMPLFRQVLVFSFFTTLLRSVFLFWIPKFLVDIGMKESSAVLGSSIFPLLGCIGVIGLGWYTDKHAKNGDRAHAMWILLAGLVICLAAIAIMISDSQVNGNLVVLLLGLSGFFLLGPYSMSAGCLTLDIAGPKKAATAAGWIDGVGYIGGALSVWVTGALSDRLGWDQVFWILCGMSLIATFIAIGMSKTFKSSAPMEFEENPAI